MIRTYFKRISFGGPEGVRRYLFSLLTRKELRSLAKLNGVKRGQNKSDTIQNLIEAGIYLNVRVELKEERGD